MDTRFSITLNSKLVPIARQLHQVSRIGDQRTGPNQTLEAYLSDLVTTAIVERSKPVHRCSSINAEPVGYQRY